MRLGVLDHPQRHAVLDTSAGVEELALAENLDAERIAQAVDAHERRVPNQADGAGHDFVAAQLYGPLRERLHRPLAAVRLPEAREARGREGEGYPQREAEEEAARARGQARREAVKAAEDVW